MERTLTRLFLNAFLLIALLLGLVGPVAAGGPAGATGASYMPPEPGKIAAALIARGVIPPDATPEEVDAAVAAYLQTKTEGHDKTANPAARARLLANEAALSQQAFGQVRGRKLDTVPETIDPSVPQFKEGAAGPDKLLVILVDFSGEDFTWETATGEVRTEAGPLHNQIPEPDNSFDLWVPDFSTEHFQDMLFTPGGWTFPEDETIDYRYEGETRGSMYDYYVEQSYGAYQVSGEVFGWFTVDKPEAFYGDDSEDGSDNLRPGTTADLIADAVEVINDQGAIDWAQYDTDGDGTIDHPLFVHAGIDQSGGGGAQGDDAIWAHSASVDVQVALPDHAHPDGIWIRNYTIMPEDGGVGVFAHEFGHDLGLPDEYDTMYSGRGASTAFWSLMASGSWVGQPAQTQPPDISIWGRYALGWVGEDNLAVVDAEELTKNPAEVRLEQAERWGGGETINALRVNLPDKDYYVNEPYSGVLEWFGGKADEIDTTLRRTVDLTGKTGAALSFWTWYDIEENWDYGFVQVSTDGGETWASLEIDGTSYDIVDDGYPAIFPNMPGFTGTSDGWVYKEADLSGYAGQSILLQFRYMTDWATTMPGFYVDDISVVADGETLFFDGAETPGAAWAVDGWTQEPGFGVKAHYYMLEWRNSNTFTTPYGTTPVVNFDAGLSNVYQYDSYGSTGNPNEPYYFPYAPGLLVWYRDGTYSLGDNWTGAHPGGGFLLVVDAHDHALLRPPATPPADYAVDGVNPSGALPWSTQVQSYDAAFSFDPSPTIELGYWGTPQTIDGLNAVPNFDDSQSYWSRLASAASVQTPTYGFVFRLLGQAEDGSATLIGLGAK